VLPVQVALDMNMMLNSAVENGTGRRARLDNIQVAGKTGTTNGYRDAWFVGFTGNYVGGVWFGNDDYAPMNRMTGGSLPAMTWQKIMSYAHQGIELKSIPGVAPAPKREQPVVADAAAAAAKKPGEAAPPPRPTLLTKRGADVLVRVERLMDDAARAMPVINPSVSTNDTQRGAALDRPATLVSAAKRNSGETIGGN